MLAVATQGNVVDVAIDRDRCNGSFHGFAVVGVNCGLRIQPLANVNRPKGICTAGNPLDNPDSGGRRRTHTPEKRHHRRSLAAGDDLRVRPMSRKPTVRTALSGVAAPPY